MQGQLGSNCARPAGIKLCKAAGIKLCKASWDQIVQGQLGSDLVLVDFVRFGPNGSGPEASRCARIMRHASGNASDPTWIGSSMFPGGII